MYKRKVVLVVLLMGMIALLSCSAETKEITPKNQPQVEIHEGWWLAVQSYSFKKFTFFEGVEKTAALGMKYIEGSGGRQVSNSRADVKFSQLSNSSQVMMEVREEVKKKLKATDVKLVSYGVVELPNDEEVCRQVFEFAKDMGIDILLSEPPKEAFDLIERLCKEYNIKVAIHNHAEPSLYWHPDSILTVCQGRSKLIGACADTGHWMRSGLDPIWALKRLEGRLISLHLKDRNGYGMENTHDVPWGTGKANVKAILAELHRQNFKGVIAIEYEYNWENSMPDIKQCVEYYNKVVSELMSTAIDKD